MKFAAFLAVAWFLPLSLAQTPSPPPAKEPTPNSASAGAPVPAATQTPMPARDVIQPAFVRTVTYGGVFAQAARTDRPLELLNPWAPVKYGNGRRNLDLDPTTGKPRGITFFSIHFGAFHLGKAKKPKT